MRKLFHSKKMGELSGEDLKNNNDQEATKRPGFFIPSGSSPELQRRSSSPEGISFYSMEGYILIWRKLLETSFYKNSYCLHLAIHLLLNANHKSKKILFNGQEVEVLRGQTIIGRYQLSNDTGIAPGTVYDKLKILEKCNFISIKSNNKFSIVTILNYESYQNPNNSKQHLKQQQGNNKATTEQQQSNTNKECNNDKECNKCGEIPPPLEEVVKYCKERNNGVDPHKWFNHYQAKGWMIGKNKMKDWQAAVRTWEEKKAVQITVRKPL